MSLENPEDLAPIDALNLRDTVGIAENDTNLRRRQPLLRKFADVLLHLEKTTKIGIKINKRTIEIGEREENR